MRSLFALMAFTNAAWAVCDDGEALFMACDFANGKSVEVCTDGNIADYTFGRPGQTPELSISLAFQQGAQYVPWNGVGRYIWEAMRLTNNDVTYEVYGSIDRHLATQHDPANGVFAMAGGIVVEDFDGTELAHLRCLPASVNFGY